MHAFVFYFALLIAGACAQAQNPPQDPAIQRQPGPSKLSQTEVPKLRARAEAGDASAQFDLGKAYESGNGVSKNDESAVKWYRKAADQGNADAENMLGVMYLLGQGVSRDKEEAVRWYHKAAKQGNSQAMFNLGASYYNGEGVPSNPNRAYAWFLLAQEAGNPAADDAVKRSAEEAGRLGTPTAVLQIGTMYETGDELSQSDPQAAKWYGRIADVSPAAGVRLASLMINSKNIAHDYGRAMHLCRDAASKRYSDGDLCVAYLYRKGLGTSADTEEAIKWYEEAGELGSRQAELIMGQIYWRGEGVAVDRAEAYFHLYRAARLGGPDVRPLAEQLRQEMNEDEMNRFDKKLRQWHLNPDKVLSFMEEKRPQ